MFVDPIFLHTPTDIILLNYNQIPSCHFLLLPGRDAMMPAAISVAQKDHSFHWSQMQSQLTILSQ